MREREIIGCSNGVLYNKYYCMVCISHLLIKIVNVYLIMGNLIKYLIFYYVLIKYLIFLNNLKNSQFLIITLITII